MNPSTDSDMEKGKHAFFRATKANVRDVLGELKVYDVCPRLKGQKLAAPTVINIVPEISTDGSMSGVQLYLDEIPIPPNLFEFDSHDRVLVWHKAFGGGRMFLSHDGKYANGSFGQMGALGTFKAGASANFTCSVAEKVGAKYVSMENQTTSIDWDTSSDDWKNADWKGEMNKDRLHITYTIQDGSDMHHDIVSFQFHDNYYDIGDPIPIVGGQYTAHLGRGTHEGQTGWVLNFENTGDDPNDGAGVIDDVMIPMLFRAFEDAFVTKINGAMCTDSEKKGALFGIDGTRSSSLATGYYKNGTSMPFGVFQGTMKIDGRPMAGLKSFVKGEELHWKGLSSEFQLRLGLPAEGVMKFSNSGLSANVLGSNVCFTRLTAEEALRVFTAPDSMCSNINSALKSEKFSSISEKSSDPDLKIEYLAQMTPFGKDDEGKWTDIVQNGVLEDMWTIINSYVPSELWNSLFPNGPSKPVLDGKLAEIASSKVEINNVVYDPANFYPTLSTQVLCISLKDSKNENAKLLNAVRAETQLKELTSKSPVYQNHSQQLFNIHWLKKYDVTTAYIQDQLKNTQEQKDNIDAELQLRLDDIKNNVYQDPGSKLKEEMSSEITNAANYAKTNGLYWAFSLYTYNTDPTALATFQMALSMGGSEDATLITRIFQSTCASLTAVDSSLQFQKMYLETLNTFFGSTLIQSLMDFSSSEITPDLVETYIDKFVYECLNSDDPDLKQAGKDIQQSIEDGTWKDMVSKSVDELQSLAETVQGVYAMKTIASKFTVWFKKAFNLKNSTVCNAIMISMTAISAVSLLFGIENFSDMSPEDKANFIISAVQTGMQAMCAILKLGSSLASWFSAAGSTVAGRIACFGKFAWNGLASCLDRLSRCLSRLGSRLGKWLAGVAGGASRALMSISAKGVSKVLKYMGKNLDRFITTRAGPVFSLAGIAFNIAGIAEGDKGLMLGSDIAGILSGTLEIFSICGEWALSAVFGEEMVAAIISVSGPLAVVLALVELGLAIASFFKEKPHPVLDFVNNQAADAGLALTSACNAIDYTQISYQSPGKGYEVVGSFLTPNSSTKQLCGKQGSNVVLGDNDWTPNYILQFDTDAQGRSKIYTSVGDDKDGYSDVLYLGVSDNAGSKMISFESVVDSDVADDDDSKMPLWKCETISNEAILENGFFSSTKISIAYFGSEDEMVDNRLYMSVDSNGNVVLSENATSWSVAMDGMKPVEMSVHSPMSFVYNNLTSSEQSYAPNFTMRPSDTMQYDLDKSLPSFLSFDHTKGEIKPTGGTATPIGDSTYTMTGKNPLGTCSAEFVVSVHEI